MIGRRPQPCIRRTRRAWPSPLRVPGVCSGILLDPRALVPGRRRPRRRRSAGRRLETRSGRAWERYRRSRAWRREPRERETRAGWEAAKHTDSAAVFATDLARAHTTPVLLWATSASRRAFHSPPPTPSRPPHPLVHRQPLLVYTSLLHQRLFAPKSFSPPPSPPSILSIAFAAHATSAASLCFAFVVISTVG